MSLRDQLLAKGLVSKKDAARVDRELRDERKASQGNRRRQHELEREAKAAAEAEAKRRLEQQAAERQATQAAREAHEHVYRVRQIVRSHRLAGRGPVPFHFRYPESPRIGCLYLRETVARELRNGNASIAACRGDDGAWEVAVITRKGADKLATVEPTALLHHVRDLSHLADPSESLLVRTWPSGLGPHRVRDDAELRAYQRRG